MNESQTEKTKGANWRLLFFIPRIIALFYIISAGLLYLFQDGLVFPGADNKAENVQDIEEKFPDSRLVFEVPQSTLQGWHINKGTAKPMLIYYGGNAEDVSFRVQQLNRLEDYQTVVVNYRGYGLSTGQPSEQLLYADALYVYDQLVEKHQPSRVYLIGRSLGTGVATYVVNHRVTHGVVLITPFDSVTNIGQDRYPLMPVSLLAKHDFDSYSRAENIKVPTLVVLSETDKVVEHQYSERLINVLPRVEMVTTLSGVDHGDIVTHPSFVSLLESFLSTH